MKNVKNQESKALIREFKKIQEDYQKFWNQAKEALVYYDDRVKFPVDTEAQQVEVMTLQLEQLKKINAAYVQHCKTKTKRELDSMRFYNEFIKPAEEIIAQKKVEKVVGTKQLTFWLWMRELFLRLIGKR